MRRGIVSFLLACLLAGLLSSSASALSIAPKAAEEYGCEVEHECVMTQPSTPSWLTLSGGEAMLTQQSLDGTAANEYGTNSEADTTLYGSAQAYGTSPASSAAVVGSTLANFAGSTDPGDTYAVVLRSDRTLEVLGPQSSGYALAVSTTVPEPGALVGVVALAPPPGSTEAPAKVMVITDAGFYIYGLSTAGPATLTLQAGAPAKSLPVEGTVSNDPAFVCTNEESLFGCAGGFGDKYEFELPAKAKLLGVYEAPVGKGEDGEAASTFAIAYTGGSVSGVDGAFTVTFFAYEPTGGLRVLGRVEEAFDSASESVKVRYAINDSYIRTALLQTVEGIGYRMSSYDSLASSWDSPNISSGAAFCPLSSGGQMPALAVDALESESGERSTGISTCATIVEKKVFYQMQRTDRGGKGLASRAQEESSVVSTPPSGSFEAPAGASLKSIEGSADMPCDEYLKQFAEHPTPDGFPETSGGSLYCAPIKEDIGRAPLEPFFGAAGNVAIQLQYVTEEEGRLSLREHSIAYEPDISLTGFAELRTEPKQASSEYDERLASLPKGSSDLAMLPLDPTGITLTGRLLESKPGEVLRTSATAKPMPIAVMAAPPYYAGAEQQVTPTSTTFANSECGGGGSEQSNTVGVFGGVDVEFSKVYEFEALAKLQATWTQSTEIENCSSFDQEFIAGNFGNNFVADNSLLFRVDTGKDTYLDLKGDSLGVGVTGGCDLNHLSSCDAIFVPTGSQYALQSMTQLRKPQPNNFYAADDEELRAEYGSALEAALPRPGNPASYPALTGGSPKGCAGAPSGSGSGNTGIVDVNPFVAPTPPPAPNLLEASQASEVNPASGGEEGGTSSTLSYDSTKQTTSSAEFSLGAEVSLKAGYAKFGAEYEHGWGSSMTESFQSGTDFGGGVFDFNGFYDPYSYRLYECKSELETTPAFAGATSVHVPVFLVDYMAEQSTDKLPLNFVAPSLSEGTVGQEYAGQVFASGGVPSYDYAITGGALPSGLSLNGQTGQIAGTPTEAGTFTFTVSVHDSVYNTASEQDTITINPPLSVSSPLPEGNVGERYEQSLGVSGGTPPYTYLLTAAGKLPPGLGIDNSTGMLEGTPTATGSYCFGVYVADSAFSKSTLETEVCVTIGDTLSIEPASLPEAIEGQGYEVTIEGQGGNHGGYVYTAKAPAVCQAGFTCSEAKPLPEGLGLDPSGSITRLDGTPTAPGSYEFAIDLSDGEGGYAEHVYQLTVAAESAGITTVAPAFESAAGATVAVGGEASIPITAKGTPTPVITLSGELPAGMSFSGGSGGSAKIEGTPAPGTTGIHEVTLIAQNGIGAAARQTFVLVVQAGPAVTEQPTDQTAVAPAGTATFTAGASGSPAPTVSWEVSSDAGKSWSVISGASSETLTLTGIEASEDGNEYRAVFTNAQGSATTEPAVLTVDFPPTITSQPVEETVITGESASFTAAAAGRPSPELQWQVSTDDGATWTNIYGANEPTLTLPAVPAKDDGNSYRAVFTNIEGTTISEPATLIVQSSPLIVTQPQKQTVVEGAAAAFSAAASGNPEPTVQWQVSTDNGEEWKPVKGATEPTLTIAEAPASADGDLYEAVFTNAAGSVTSAAVALDVQTPPSITTQPAAASTIAGGNATFEAAAKGSPEPTVQWQISTDGGRTWTDVAGADSDSLALLNVPAADEGELYRAVFSNAAGSASSEAAKLSVDAAPAVAVPPSGAVASPEGTATFTVIVTGSPAPSIQWQVSEDGGKTWTDVPGATSVTLHLTDVTEADSGKLYRAVLTNTLGSITTEPVTLIVSPPAPASSKLCSGTPAHMIFLNRRLGPVVRYTVFVNGRRAKTVHGRNLRSAALPTLERGWQAVRIVAFTKKRFMITTRRVYFECVRSLGVSKRRTRTMRGAHAKHAHRGKHG